MKSNGSLLKKTAINEENFLAPSYIVWWLKVYASAKLIQSTSKMALGMCPCVVCFCGSHHNRLHLQSSALTKCAQFKDRTTATTTTATATARARASAVTTASGANRQRYQI